jgi:uncharacterized membrane protein YeaQ/YmgE (transglycosylase-associated protein family)
MGLLLLVWFLIGLLLGALANGARLRPLSWGKRGWLYMLVLGVIAALLCGWIATWVMGVQFATVTVLWVTVLVVGVFPRLGTWVYLRNRHV